uniref:SET domain-containing protein n=1 Tax=Paramoeba aestuarina TaxID=180227 RepID=A0A7S4U5V9_9EUKA
MIDDPEKFMALKSHYHRALVMPYCGISFRQSLLQFSSVPLAALNVNNQKVLLERGDMGVSTLANCAIAEGETIFCVRGPLVSEANVYTVQVDQGRHMSFSGGPEFLSHSCQPNLKLVIEKHDEKAGETTDFPLTDEDATKCLPNLLSSVNFPEWWSDESRGSSVAFQTLYSIQVVAIRDIQKGEILSFNYLTTEFDMDEPFTCLCGGERATDADSTSLPKCFGRIQGYRYLSDAYKRLLKPLCTSVVLKCDEALE